MIGLLLGFSADPLCFDEDAGRHEHIGAAEMVCRARVPSRRILLTIGLPARHPPPYCDTIEKR
jgi:hypothetical protein